MIFQVSLKHSLTGSTAEIGLVLIAVANPDTHQRCHINSFLKFNSALISEAGNTVIETVTYLKNGF
jgi:hypothetical protein